MERLFLTLASLFGGLAVALGAFGAHALRSRLDERMLELAEFCDQNEFNRIEWGSKKIGIITSGICYQYTKDIFPTLPFSNSA